MARDGGGTYSLPAGLPSNGDTSDVADIVTPLQDIETDLNTDRPIVAGGTGASTAKGARTNLLFTKGSDIASASALTLGADGNYFDVTGTTAITSIATWNVGDTVRLHFDGALTLTHHATDLILPGAANITTAAGDEAMFVEYATGDWRCISYQRAAGIPGGLLDEDDMASNSATAGATQQSIKAYVDATYTEETEVAAASQTAIDFTGISAKVKRINVLFYAMNTSGGSEFLVQIGDSGGIETTGYASTCGTVRTGSSTSTGDSSTAGFIFHNDTTGADGKVCLERIDETSGTKWVGTVGGRQSTTKLSVGGGIKTLSGILTQVRVTTVNGTDTIDTGSVNITLEY